MIALIFIIIMILVIVFVVRYSVVKEGSFAKPNYQETFDEIVKRGWAQSYATFVVGQIWPQPVVDVKSAFTAGFRKIYTAKTNFIVFCENDKINIVPVGKVDGKIEGDLKVFDKSDMKKLNAINYFKGSSIAFFAQTFNEGFPFMAGATFKGRKQKEELLKLYDELKKIEESIKAKQFDEVRF